MTQSQENGAAARAEETAVTATGDRAPTPVRELVRIAVIAAMAFLTHIDLLGTPAGLVE
jgi:hypothetical protein